MKPIFFLSAALCALTAGMAVAAWHPAPVGLRAAAEASRLSASRVLYSQNSDFGYAIVSQNFTSGSDHTEGADDFVVPSGQTWAIREVDVTGMYFNGSGPANSEVVTFYGDKHRHPGKKLKRFNLGCTDNDGSFACTLPSAMKLAAGHYWVSVVANCNFANGCGEWGWVQNTTTHHDPGQWRDSQSGSGCMTWHDTSFCFTGAADDYAFDLRGSKQ
jgi:hypothetical protein